MSGWTEKDPPIRRENEMLVNIVLPIFLIVIAGWLLAYLNLIPEKVASGLMQYVFYAACPAIIFLTISSYEIEKLLVWRFWIAYPLSISVTVPMAMTVIIANCLVVPGILFIFELHAKKDTFFGRRSLCT